jgi:hypothetical protein
MPETPRARRGPRLVPRLLRWLLAAGAAALVFTGGRRVSAAVASSEIFRVASIELEGARFLALDEAIRTAAVEPGSGVWDDASAWESRLEAHALVRRARVRRRLPTTLVLVVEEEEPVAFVPTPVLEPVDRDGRYLPLDPALHRLDLPVIRPRPADDGETRPSQARVLPLTRAVERLRADPAFFARVSEMSLERDGSLRIRWGADPEVVFHVEGVVEPERIRQGVQVLAHALETVPDRRPRAVDLRFDDQVVVRY